MNTVAIDRNTLNGLMDNQKKLDELFDSIFDSDNYFISGSSSSSQSGSRYSTYEVESQYSYSSDNANGAMYAIKHNPFYYVLPIVFEISIIYMIVSNFL